MILTISDEGNLAVYETGSYTELNVDTLSELYDQMDFYDVDFISPTLSTPQKYTKNNTVLRILKAFELERTKVTIALKLFGSIPKA